MRIKVNAVTILCFLAILFATGGKAQKVDTIYHINGNILTGEFKKLN
jgi:hypothetical protein